MNDVELVITITIVACVTFFLRSCPFFFFSNNKKMPKFISYLGEVLPYAVMGMLVVYCFKSINLIEAPHGVAELTASAVVIAAHKLKHNMLLSICSGTAIYMIMQWLLY